MYFRKYKNILTLEMYLEIVDILLEELNTIGGDTQLFVVISINGKKARAIIDSGVIGNFISPTIVSSLGLTTELKDELY